MKKDPKYKLRYSSGLGDIITCLLHSKYLKKIVKLITKSEEQCQECTNRAYFLNLFFPIPIWRLFYKNIDDRFLAFKKDMEDYGYIFDTLHKKAEESEKKCSESCECKKTVDINPLNPLKIDYIEYDGYSLKSKKEYFEDGYKVVKFIYNKN
jgi:hypothetical protein